MTDPEAPTWLTEAIDAAWYELDWVDRRAVAIAVRAAAPIIAALTLASVSRPIEPRGRLAPEDYEDVAALRAQLAELEDANNLMAHVIDDRAELRAQLADARRATLNEAADALLKHRIDLHDSWAGYRNSVRDGRLGGLEEAATLLREWAKGGSE